MIPDYSVRYGSYLIFFCIQLSWQLLLKSLFFPYWSMVPTLSYIKYLFNCESASKSLFSWSIWIFKENYHGILITAYPKSLRQSKYSLNTQSCSQYPLNIFYFPSHQYWYVLFHSWYCLFWSLFTCYCYQKFSNFIRLSKEPTFDFVIFCLFSFSLIFALTFSIYFFVFIDT